MHTRSCYVPSTHAIYICMGTGIAVGIAIFIYIYIYTYSVCMHASVYIYVYTYTRVHVDTLPTVVLWPDYTQYIYALEQGLYHRYNDWLPAGRPRGCSSSPYKDMIFHLCTSSRPVLGSTQPPMQCIPVALFTGKSGRVVKLTIQLQLLPRSRIGRSIHPAPHTYSLPSA
jgi:hypothetical protein